MGAPATSQVRDDPMVALARRAASGDLAATRELLEAVTPRVTRVVARVLGARHPDLEDVSQESLIALTRALPAFRGDCAPQGYAARIAVRTAVAARRKSERRQAQRQALSAKPEPAPSVGAEAAAARRLALLRALLTELPAGQGETLALRVLAGASIEEIAETTAVPINTVRSRLRLAKRALRIRISEDPILAEELEVTT